MHDIKTIIFDLGRVLVDIHAEGDKFQALMLSLGIPPDEAFPKYSYIAEVQRHMTGELSTEDFYRIMAERYDLDYDFASFQAAWCDIFRPMPGMAELFEELAARYRIGLLSDTDPLHWGHLREALPHLRNIAAPTLSFEVGYLKPHPVMFETAAANCGADVGQCLFIDDLLSNVDGARFSGMPGLHFTGEKQLRKALAGLKVL